MFPFHIRIKASQTTAWYPTTANIFTRQFSLIYLFSLYQPWVGQLNLIKKVKVSHSLIAVGAVGVRVPLYLGHSWWKAEPIPLLSLPYPSLIRKRYPFSAEFSSRRMAQPSLELTRYGDFLHHSRAALTTRPRRLSRAWNKIYVCTRHFITLISYYKLSINHFLLWSYAILVKISEKIVQLMILYRFY